MKNLILGQILSHLTQIYAPSFNSFFRVLPLLDVRHCRKLSLYAISRKTYDPNSINEQKPHFGPDLRSFSPNLGCQKIFLKNLASSVTRFYGQLSPCTISEKTNDPILRKLSDRWTDG